MKSKKIWIFKVIVGYPKKMRKYLISKKLVRGVCNDIKRHWSNMWKRIDIWLAHKSWKRFSKSIPTKNNQIMFRTYQDEYTCNPKYLCDEIIRQGLDYKLVWVHSKKTMNRKKFPPQVTLVKHGTYKYYEEMARSKFWIDNAHNFTWEPFYKKKDQVLINLWHGSLGLKRIDPDADSNAHRREAGKRDSKITDYCISNSVFEETVFKTTYWPNTPMKRFGHARNDLMFVDEQTTLELKERVCEELKIDSESRILLYAPTFRDGDNFDCFNIDYEALHDALQQRFGGEWVILTRFHYHTKALIKKKSKKLNMKEYPFVASADNYVDIQELIAATDVALTDYSSWICDFVLTKRPGFLFTYDIDTYVTERGFYYPLEDTPFPIARTNEELINNVLTFDEEAYAHNMTVYLDKLGCCEDGHAAERIVELIQERTEI